MKILLGYNPETGQISDPIINTPIVCWVGLSHLEHKDTIVEVEKEVTVRDIADKLSQLHMAGFQAEDIIKLKEAGLL